ncbi:MAG TPA: family 1 glycosylhydrolase [Puia sp.]|nr:family 1 glycosylhydrolase [Puia sp.]
MSPRLKTPYYNPEIWGGIECTINRINGEYSDQLADTGHYSRHSDIDELARLGIRALRYPLLWERHQPEMDTIIDWSWAESQLDRIRRRGITPLIGLLHHGSGPSFTDLSNPHFPEHFAAYAGEVAARFPWIEYFTPINEPLTTARFSGLYGLWYPHRTDPLSFLTMLLNQVKGTVLAMKAIRRVNSEARLIQTEDLAKIHSSPELSYQADFENHRRWLTFDLLCGQVDQFHPLWDYLLFAGVTAEQLSFFTENPCPPDIMGLNYYVTSERYLDSDIAKYPADRHGGNGRHCYVDTEAARVIRPTGTYRLLWEAWERYGLPIAITEVHLNAGPDEQIRWVKNIWDNACWAKEMGVDIRAVTVWSLLGSVDWDSLLTRKDGHYESGPFDIFDNELHMNALGYFIQSIAAGRKYEHAVHTIKIIHS